MGNLLSGFPIALPKGLAALSNLPTSYMNTGAAYALLN